MNPYDSQHYQPPAPVVSLTLRTLDGQNPATATVVAVIDTGADVTLLPRRIVKQLGLAPAADESVKLAWFDGSLHPAESVELEAAFQGGRFRGRYALIDQRHGIVGRNILNHFRLLFDGPAKTWQRVATA